MAANQSLPEHQWAGRGLANAFFAWLATACAVQAAVAAGPPATAAPAMVDAAREQQPPLTDQQRRQLQVFGPILLNSSSDVDPQTRRHAAQELISMGIPQAIDLLDGALRCHKPAVMLAAISAMHSLPKPVPALLDSVIAALPDAPPETLDSLSWAVARYGDVALEPVARLATDQHTSSGSRLGPIHALGAFGSREAASWLMRLVETPADHSALSDPAATEVAKAACASLERMTGIALGGDQARWQQWWRNAGDLSDDQWFKLISESLSARTADLEQQLQQQRQASDRTARELLETYRDLYPVLSTDEQIRRLPKLLEDALPPVREFAMSRVLLLVRDSVRIPPEIQQKLAERLSDESPALRVQAARVLDELNYEMAGPMIAARLDLEQAPETIGGMLEVLAKRPCVEAIAPVQRWLSDPEMSERSAEVLWRLAAASKLTHEQLAALCASTRSAMNQHPAAAVARLLALIGDDQDVARLTEGLDAADSAMRSAVAEGFCRRGLRRPLIERAYDDAIYPFAVRVLADGPADLGNLRLLSSLRCSPLTQHAWAQAIVKLAAGLPSAQLLTADDMLAALPYADAALRRDVLARGAVLPREELAAEVRGKIIGRLAPLLIDLGDAANAYDLLESLNNEMLISMEPIRFQAAVMSGHYDKAAQLEGSPGSWLALLSRMSAVDSGAAAALRDEISRRFAEKMTLQDRTSFAQLCEGLQQAADASVTTNEPPP